jgi:hypothetical protein
MRMRIVAGLLALATGVGVTGCDERTDRILSDGTLTQDCRPSIGPTGKEERQTHPTKPSECSFGVVLKCNACVYKPDGTISHSTSEVCGVCFGGTF